MGPNFPISRKLKRYKLFNSVIYFFQGKNMITLLSIQKYLYSFLNYNFQNLILSKPKMSYQNNELNIKIFYFFDKNFNTIYIRKKKLHIKKRLKALGALKNVSQIKEFAGKSQLDHFRGLILKSAGLSADKDITNSIQNSHLAEISSHRESNSNITNNSLICLINNIINKENNTKKIMNKKDFILFAGKNLVGLLGDQYLKKLNTLKQKSNKLNTLKRAKRHFNKELYLFFIQELNLILKILINNRLNLNLLQIIESIILIREKKLKIYMIEYKKILESLKKENFYLGYTHKKLTLKKIKNIKKKKYFISNNIKNIKFILKFLEALKIKLIENKGNNISNLETNISDLSSNFTASIKKQVKYQEYYNENWDSNSSKPTLKYLENYISFKLGIKTNIHLVRLKSPLLNSHILAKYIALNLKKHSGFYIWKKLNAYIKIQNTAILSPLSNSTGFIANSLENALFSKITNKTSTEYNKIPNHLSMSKKNFTSDLLNSQSYNTFFQLKSLKNILAPVQNHLEKGGSELLSEIKGLGNLDAHNLGTDIENGQKYYKGLTISVPKTKEFVGKNQLVPFQERNLYTLFEKYFLHNYSSSENRISSVSSYKKMPQHLDLLNQFKKWFIIKLWMKKFFTQRITGIKLKISGRFNKRKGATKTQVKYYSRGSFKFNSIHSFIDYGYFERKDRNGSQTIKVLMSN